jgi:hypothetical protein
MAKIVKRDTTNGKTLLGKVQADELASGLADARYEHEQATPALVWEIQHNLNKNPSVIVIDSAGSTMEGTIEYMDENNLQILFRAQFGGKAYLN